MQNDIQKMSSYKKQVKKYGTPISGTEYEELKEYAHKKKIRLAGFKDFVGDIYTIQQVIDDIDLVAKDFPLLISDKKGITLELEYEDGREIISESFSGFYSMANNEFANEYVKECKRIINEGGM